MGVMGAVGLGSAVLGYMGQQEATSAANSRNAAQMAQSQRQWEQSDPFSAGGHRQQYVTQLNDLMKGGVSSFVDDPNFKRMMAQGLQQSQRHASATGTAQSGQEQIALQEQGSNLANSYFNQQYERLASLSGATSRSAAPSTGMGPEAVYDMSMAGTRSAAGLLQGTAGIYNNFNRSPSTGGAGSMSGNGSVQGNPDYVNDL
jgi:hypothetical protein